MIPFCKKENRTKGCGDCWRFQFSSAGGLDVVDPRLPAVVLSWSTTERFPKRLLC